MLTLGVAAFLTHALPALRDFGAQGPGAVPGGAVQVMSNRPLQVLQETFAGGVNDLKALPTRHQNLAPIHLACGGWLDQQHEIVGPERGPGRRVLDILAPDPLHGCVEGAGQGRHDIGPRIPWLSEQHQPHGITG
ncbi:MAG: hypothetical protein ACO26M_01815 [Limnohabitans sp.]